MQLNRIKCNYMLYKQSIIITVVMFLAYNCHAQVNWQTTKNWKLYDIHSPTAVRYTLDTLKNFKSSVLEEDSIKAFLDKVVMWPNGKSALWMGSYIATCESGDGKLRKLLISTYGGFFYDQAAQRYYQLPEELVDDWLELLSNRSKKMIVLK